jgi:hypothetical protein
VGEGVWELLCFVAPLCVSVAIVESVCGGDCKGLRLCTVGTGG